MLQSSASTSNHLSYMIVRQSKHIKCLQSPKYAAVRKHKVLLRIPLPGISIYIRILFESDNSCHLQFLYITSSYYTQELPHVKHVSCQCLLIGRQRLIIPFWSKQNKRVNSKSLAFRTISELPRNSARLHSKLHMNNTLVC